MSINDKFEKALMENLGAESLLNEKLSPYKIFERGYKAATAQSQQELARQALRIEELEKGLTMLNDEYKRLPHSLGYQFTHTPEIDKLLSTTTTTTTTTNLDDYVMNRLEHVASMSQHFSLVPKSLIDDNMFVGFDTPLYRLKESDK